MNEDHGGNEPFQVVANAQGQYSILPAHKPMPAGWRPAGPCATREQCLDFIETAWPDITVLSCVPQAN